jgi:hypothetical protein
MALDPTQVAKFEQWLQSKGVKLFLVKCPACGNHGSRTWVLGDISDVNTVQAPGNMSFGGSDNPMVRVFCSNCACVMLFLAHPMGLP